MKLSSLDTTRNPSLKSKSRQRVSQHRVSRQSLHKYLGSSGHSYGVLPISLYCRYYWGHSPALTNQNYVFKWRHKYVNEGWWDLGHRTCLEVCAYLQEGPDLQGVHIIGPPSHRSPISLVPHLIGSPSHWSPISLIPISLIPQLAHMHHSFHWSPISLVPHLIGPLLIGPPIHKSLTTLFELIGPPSHWSPFSSVHPFSANPNGPPSHWSPISLVPQLVPTHRPFHWSPISLVPHPIGPFSPAGPPIHKFPPHCLNSMAPFSLPSPLVTLFTLFSFVPHLIRSPM